MTVTHSLVQFALVAGLLTLTPGIDTALVLRQALTRSRRVAMLTAVGIGTGCLLWGIDAAIGISALVTASQLAYGVVKLAGALYLLWMGVQMLWHAIRGDHPDLGTTGSTATSAHAAFLKGLLTNVLNPKIGVFYVAVLPQFLPHGVSPLAMGAALAGIHFVEGLLWFGTIVLAAHRMRAVLGGRRTNRVIDSVTGTVLVGFGADLALTTRF